MTALYQFKDQNMSITLTEKAAQRVRTFLENRGKGIGLRLGVKTSGCSGLGYVLESGSRSKKLGLFRWH